MLNIQDCAFYKHIHEQNSLIQAPSVLPRMQQSATKLLWFHYGKTSAPCLHHRCSSTGRNIPATFQGLDKILLGELECLVEELSSAGSSVILLSHILCLKWESRSLLWCTIPIHLHVFLPQLWSSEENNLTNSALVTKSTDAWDKFLNLALQDDTLKININILGTAQFCLCLLGLRWWTSTLVLQKSLTCSSKTTVLVLVLKSHLC